jgi:predicted TIM-barrel fold metal-dependent hydrolase
VPQNEFTLQKSYLGPNEEKVMAETLKVVDADTHISESEAMWELLDKEMHHRRPVLVSVPEGTLYGERDAFWLIDGNIFPKPAGRGGFNLITPSAAKRQRLRTDIDVRCREITDPRARLADMDRLGFDAQVIYPTLFLIYLTDDVALEVALCRAYNRWMAQVWSQAKDRLRWVVVPPLRSVEESIKEIRWARERGAVGVFFRGIEGNLTLDNPYFFPVYREAADLDLPICIHQGSGCPTFINFFNLERNRQWSHSAILPLFAFNDIVNNKIPELFPRLKFGFIEAYATWVPYLLHSFQRQFREDWKFSSSRDLFREYRIYVACETGENLSALVDCIGEDHLLMGSDYGHNDPFEQRNFLPVLRGQKSVSSRVAEKMVRDNPCAFYGL